MRGPLFVLLLCAQEPSLDEWVRRLGDESPELREKAERVLLEAGEPALPALRKAREGADAEVRTRARRIVHRLEYGSAINPLIFSRYPDLLRLFDEGDPARFLDACHRSSGAMTVLEAGLEAYCIRLLDHPSAAVRRGAAIELWSPNRGQRNLPRHPIATLLRLIERWDAADDPDGMGLQALSELVFKLSSSIDRDRLAAARAARPEAGQALRLLRGDTEAILKTLESGTGWMQELAIRSAGKLRLEAARPVFHRWMAARAVPWLALQAFAEIAGPADREVFVDYACKAPVKQWSYLEFALLGKVGAREAAPLLLEALAIPDQRRYAAPVLADWGVQEAFEPLCALIRDNNTNDRHLYDWCAARLATAETVGRLLDAGSTYGLRAATDPAVRRVVLDRLRNEERPKERKWLFELLRYSELGKSQAGQKVIEEIARRPADPLAFEASILLLRRRGAEALPLAEAALGKAVDPHWEQVEVLRRYPNDRLADLMEQRGDVGYLEALGTPAAREALGRIASGSKDALTRHAAAGSLAWIGGDAREALARALAERTANQNYWAPDRFADLLEADEPGFRDELRRQVKAQGVRPFFSLLVRWAHPEMIPELRKLLVDTPKVKREKAAAEDLMSGMCATGRAVDATGWHAVQALGATGDRSLLPFFLELLHEPESRTQQIAIEILGRWRAAEAVPALRQLVLSGDFLTRMEAIRALGEIGGPGVADFLKEQLRDTPDDTAHALARLGADARAEVKALLARSGDAYRLLGALDLMTNPKAYAKIDGPLPRRMSRRVADLPALLERLTGTAARLSAGVRKALGEEDHVWYDWKTRTLREALDRMGQYGPTIRLGHVFREGAIEICTLDEARDFWARGK